MGRKAANACSACSSPMPKAKMRDDGAGGLRCKAGHGCAKDEPAAETKASPARTAKKSDGPPSEREIKIRRQAGTAIKGWLQKQLPEAWFAAEEIGNEGGPTPDTIGGAALAGLVLTGEILERDGKYQLNPKLRPAQRAASNLRDEALAFLRANPEGSIPYGVVASNIDAKPSDVLPVLLAECEAGTVERNETDRGAFRAKPPERTLALPGIDLVTDEPCVGEAFGGCDAAIGEACAFPVAEPRSWAHSGRFERFAAPEQQRALRAEGIRDRIRALVDRNAALPGDPPVPTLGAVKRELMIVGECDVFTVEATAEAMIERGELLLLGEGKDAYLRRAPGAPPVAMGRVGVPQRAAPAPAAPETAAIAPKQCSGDEDCERHAGHNEAPSAGPTAFVHASEHAPLDLIKERMRLLAKQFVGLAGMIERLSDDNAAGLRAELEQERRDRAAERDVANDRIRDAQATIVRLQQKSSASKARATRHRDRIRRAFGNLRTCRNVAASDRDRAVAALAEEREVNSTMAAQLAEERAEHAKTRELASSRGAERAEAEAAQADAIDRVHALRFGVTKLCEALGRLPADSLSDVELVRSLRDAIKSGGESAQERGALQFAEQIAAAAKDPVALAEKLGLEPVALDGAPTGPEQAAAPPAVVPPAPSRGAPPRRRAEPPAGAPAIVSVSHATDLF